MAAPRQIRFVMDENIRSKWYSRKFFEFFRAVPGTGDQSTRNTIMDLLNAGEVVCPWSGAVPDSAEWLTAPGNDADKPAQWVTLPFSLSGSPGSEPSPHDITITFEEPA